jgi:hypothetical protein
MVGPFMTGNSPAKTIAAIRVGYAFPRSVSHAAASARRRKGRIGRKRSGLLV